MTVDEMDRAASDNTLKAAERHMEGGGRACAGCRYCLVGLTVDDDVPAGLLVCLVNAGLVTYRGGRTEYTGDAYIMPWDATDEQQHCDLWEV